MLDSGAGFVATPLRAGPPSPQPTDHTHGTSWDRDQEAAEGAVVFVTVRARKRGARRPPLPNRPPGVATGGSTLLSWPA